MKGKVSYVFLLAGWFAALAGYSQSNRTNIPAEDSICYELGDSVLFISRWRYETASPLQLVLLHHNEQTANAAAEAFSVQAGAEYLRLLNNGQRLVAFNLNDTVYRFDPNRMFSAAGAGASLKREGLYSDTAHAMVLRFAETMLRLMDTTKVVVAMHNNTDKWYSVLDYINDGSSRVHRNPALDTDNFFLTNDAALFERFQRRNVNVVLEDAPMMEDDGSLSILFGRRKWKYVNVETEHGHDLQQQQMLVLLKVVLTD